LLLPLFEIEIIKVSFLQEGGKIPRTRYFTRWN
jgi:hypothetical protein